MKHPQLMIWLNGLGFCSDVCKAAFELSSKEEKKTMRAVFSGGLETVIEREDRMDQYDSMPVAAICALPNHLATPQQLADQVAERFGVTVGRSFGYKDRFRFSGRYGEREVHVTETLAEWKATAKMLMSNPYYFETGKVPKTADELIDKLTKLTRDSAWLVRQQKRILSE